MRDGLHEELSGCGCCGRLLVPALVRMEPGMAVDERLEPIWCVDCVKHVSRSGCLEERTYHALQGRRCPFEGAPLEHVWLRHLGTMPHWHLGSTYFSGMDGATETWCGGTVIVYARSERSARPAAQERCKRCMAKYARVAAERLMQESVQ